MPSFRPRHVAPVLVTMFASGCATAVSNPPAACPPLVAYSRTFQAQAATELDELPPDSAVVRMMQDYGTLRDQIRACR